VNWVAEHWIAILICIVGYELIWLHWLISKARTRARKVEAFCRELKEQLDEIQRNSSPLNGYVPGRKPFSDWEKLILRAAEREKKEGKGDR
jgi:hypothetical protein